MASHHRVSFHLKDMHPYTQDDFPREIDEKEVARALGDRSLPKLLEVLRLEELDESIHYHALRYLREHVVKPLDCSKAIKAGSVPVLSNILHRCVDVPRLASIAAECVGRLGDSIDGGVIIAESTAIFNLVRAVTLDPSIHEDSAAIETLKKESGSALQRMTTSHTGKKELLNNVLELSDRLVKSMLSTGDDELRRSILRTLHNLALRAESLATLHEKGTVAGCVELCSSGDRESLRLTLEVLACLGNSLKGKEALVASGAIAAVAPLLMHDDAEVQAMATRCALMASGCLPGKKQLGEVRGAVEGLCARAFDDRIDVAISAIYAMENAGELPQSREKIRHVRSFSVEWYLLIVFN